MRRLCCRVEIDEGTGEMTIPHLPAQKITLPELESEPICTEVSQQRTTHSFTPLTHSLTQEACSSLTKQRRIAS